MPELSAPNRRARPSGRRRTGLFLVGTLLLVLIGIPLIGTYEKTSKVESTEAANRPLIVEPGGQPSVMQVRATTKKARAENIQYVLSLDQEVYVDVRAPGIWLQQRMGELGKQDLDPRAKITLDTVVYDPETEKEEHERHKALRQEQGTISAERERVKALPNDSPEKKARSDALEQRQASLAEEADTLLLRRRNSAWEQAVKMWLERSCLVVNGRVFRDLNPQVDYGWDEYSKDKNSKGEYDHDQYQALRFRIVLTEANKQQWLELLGGTGLASKPVGVSIAIVDLFDNRTEIMPTAINPSFIEAPEWQKVSLKASTDWLTWLLLDCFSLLFLVFLYYAFVTKVLRDLGPDGLWHLSLGRCQMAFWFFIVSGSYIFLWIVTGDYRTLTSQELLLLGLSSATGLGAYLIADKTESTTARPRGSDILTQEEMDLDTAEDLESKAASESEYQKTARLTDAEALRSQQRLAEFERRAAYYKKGWGARLWRSLNDLISETNDGRPSFYRFQMIGWNLAFGIIFVRAVYYRLAMPEFSNDQLLLMGISNGTYLGFKWSVTKPDRNGK
jgi:hypothetical protein